MIEDRPSNQDLSGVLEEYLAAVDAGRALDRDEFLARHRALERELGPCLTALDFIRCLDGPTDRLLGDFRIRREIGRGGMGVVYEADQLSLGRKVALKMLPFAGILDPRQLQRFRNEAQAAAHLHHAHIVPVHAVGQERGVHYYAMQLIDGISLAELIDELRQVAGPDEPRRFSSDALRAITDGHDTRTADFARAVARLGIQAAEALDHAHDQGVIHRDVKPANLIVDASGHLWITDFGLASFTAASGPTITGDLVGTVRYMSPEQSLAKRVPIDHRTDVYSLGVTLYELLTLEQAFPGNDPHRIIQDIALREPVAIRRHNPAVPAELETIVGKAMAKLPDDRFAGAAELAEDLGRFLEDRPILARRPGPLKRAAHWGRRHRTVVWAASIVLVLAATGFAVSSLLIWRAYRSEKEAHERSVTNLDLALEALDELYLEEGRLRLRGTPLLTETDRRFLERGLRFYDRFIEANENDAGVRWEVARAYLKAGQIRSMLGDSTKALEDLRHAGALLEELEATQPEDPDRRRTLGLQHVALGRQLTALGRLDESEDALLEARRILDGLRGDPMLDSYLADVAEALASNSVQARRLDEGRAHYENAARRLRSLLGAGLATAEDRWRLGIVHQGASWVLELQGLMEEAKAACIAAVRLHEGVAEEDPGNLRYADSLAAAYRRLGVLLANTGRVEEGRELQQKAREIVEDLVRRAPNHLPFRQELAGVLSDLSKTESIRGDLEEGLSLLDKSIALERELVDLNPDLPKLRHDLTIDLENRITLMNNLGRIDECIKACEEALSECTELERLFGSRPDYRLRRARLLVFRVRLHGIREEYASIRPKLDEARRLAQEVYEAHGDVKAAVCVSEVLMAYGSLYTTAGRIPRAIESQREAIAILQDLYDRDVGDTYVAASLAADLHLLCTNLAHQGKFVECLACCDRAIGYVEGLVETQGTPNWSVTLAGLLGLAAQVHHFGQHWDESRKLVERAVDIRRGLFDRITAVDPNRMHLFSDLLMLSDLQARAGDHDAALESALEAFRHLDAIESDWAKAPQVLEQVPDSLVNVAVMLEKAGRQEEAECFWVRASKHEPSFPVMLNALAWFFATYRKPELRNPERAVRLAEKAAQREPENGYHWSTLCIARYRAGEYEKALDASGHAARLHQGGTGYELFFAAMAEWQLGRRDEALVEYRRAVNWMDAHSPDEPQLRSFRVEAEALMR